jgi:predicted nucleic acid-binding protein
MAGGSDIAARPRFVLDGSVALSWCFPDESTETGRRALESLAEAVVAVPGLWFLEVANALAVGERRGRLSADETTGALRLLARLPIQIDDRTGFPLAADLLALARSHGLSAYDAAYLELARRLSCPLATLDRRLQAAAVAAGIVLQSG